MSRSPTMQAEAAPNLLKVHGLDLSYYTGKLEAYLRNKEIAYELIEMDTRDFKKCAQATGVAQMPQVEWTDNAWLTDTHLIIPFLETQYTDTRITCDDAANDFIASLLEDFADEWLWRPALYYRWANAEDARLMSSRLADGMLRDVPLPHAIRRQFILNRQRLHFLYMDGYTRRTAPRIEAHFLETLSALEEVLSEHPFVMGNRPTVADYGFFGPMFRHFFSDPTPARIMRVQAPAVQEWVARLWNTKLSKLETQSTISRWPKQLNSLFEIIGREFAPYMQANETAWLKNQQKFEFDSEGVTFKIPAQAYRAWRYQKLKQRFQSLSHNAKTSLSALPAVLTDALNQPVTQPVPATIESLPVQQKTSNRKFKSRSWK